MKHPRLRRRRYPYQPIRRGTLVDDLMQSIVVEHRVSGQRYVFPLSEWSTVWVLPSQSREQNEQPEYVPERLPDDVYAEIKRSEYPLWPDRPIA